ncbi:MAG: hypothetical protein M0Z87_06370 [Actinomycetota bacterium]|nr:hypothetical protein [Actinomycetota bacterium]
MINLWNPSHVSLVAALVVSVALGMLHGITPDEHTWPITFSYSVGSYSSRGGRKAGFLFSAAFTLQRAIAAELAYLALGRFELATRWQYEVYVVVGLVMAASGLYVLRRGKALRVGPDLHLDGRRNLPRFMPLVHGFIAGWGVGAFATIVYTVLAPATGSAWLAWLAGALFGIGTMVTQVLFGMGVGAWMARRKLAPSDLASAARKASGRILSAGGASFVVVGLTGVALPALVGSVQLVTPIHVHNLHHLGAGFLLAVVMLGGVAFWALRKSIREVTEGRAGAGSESDGRSVERVDAR